MTATAEALIGESSQQQLLCRLIKICAIEQKTRLPAGWETLLDFENAAIDGLDLLNALLAENTRSINPESLLTTALGFVTLVGPEDDFNDMTVGDFELADICFQQYQADKSIEHLQMLVTILWRHAKDGKRSRDTPDVRKPRSFSRRLSAVRLHMIMLWYAGCRYRLTQLFPAVFGGGGDGEADMSSVTKLVHSGAGAKNGTRDQVRKTLLKEFLFDCQLEAEHAEELGKRSKQ